MADQVTRPVATRDPRPSTYTAGYPRPVAPQRHRERTFRCQQGHDHRTQWGADACNTRAGYWSSPHDGRSWTEEAFLGIGLVLTAAGILAACWLLTVLAFIAGPGR